MKVPATVSIGKHYFEVMLVEEIRSISANQDVEQAWRMGAVDIVNCQIEIKKTMIESMRQEVLLHEVIHGLSDIFAIGLSEEQVTGLAAGLYAFVLDNPEVFL